MVKIVIFTKNAYFWLQNAEMDICQKCKLLGSSKRGAEPMFWEVYAEMMIFNVFTKQTAFLVKKNENKRKITKNVKTWKRVLAPFQPKLPDRPTHQLF